MQVHGRFTEGCGLSLAPGTGERRGDLNLAGPCHNIESRNF
jgi:hypothetical protein